MHTRMRACTRENTRALRRWPESFKKEFSGHLNKFMASLTETTHIMKGHTVLFVPNEDLSDVEHAAKQKVRS